MSKLTKLRRLCDLADMVYQNAQSQLFQERQKEQALRSALDNITTAHKSRLSKQDVDTAFLGGADARWQTWIEQRQTLINSELAMCRARQLNLQQNLRRAFGRHQVLLSLLDE